MKLPDTTKALNDEIRHREARGKAIEFELDDLAIEVAHDAEHGLIVRVVVQFVDGSKLEFETTEASTLLAGAMH